MAKIKHICLVFVAVICGVAVSSPLLGAEKCTWGPSYWCNNITNAKGCNAVKHCIKAVWEKQDYPVDEDEICKICTDMVQQARDQLESNQTQNDLKAVFEGSCKLIPIDVVSNECVKLVDEFIPELIETLASQMNPQVVCSVAGLCNNARIDQLLEEYHKKVGAVQVINVRAPVSSEKCTGCYTVIDLMRNNFDGMSQEEFLHSVLKVCFKLGSYSDACAANVFKYFEDIYSHVQSSFNSENVCHVAGTCTERFHQHEGDQPTGGVQITPVGGTGMLAVKDDIPCEFCEKLVIHLRDIFTANTTEAEFKRILEGICKQTGSFKDECLSIVDQYYDNFYKYVVDEMDPNTVCLLAGLCRKGVEEDIPMAPLVPIKAAELAVKIIRPTTERLAGDDESGKGHVKIGEQSSVKVMPAPIGPLNQLPIERMMLTIPHSKEICSLCQYFLHYVQVTISDSKNEAKIKETVEKACDKLPSTINQECKQFVDSYGNAVIALLVQEIDPSQVCPLLALCPKDEVTNVEVLMTSGNDDKPSCPLCLFAVEQLESVLKNNKTEENIKNALDNLCSHLPDKLKGECVDFVDTYSRQLVEMLTAEFTPQEVCVYLKLCKDNKPDVSSLNRVSSLIDQYHSGVKQMADRNNFKHSLLAKHMLVNQPQIETNEIPDNTYNGKPLSLQKEMKDSSAQCVICEFIMSQIDKQLKDKATDEQIKKVVHGVCNFLPKDVGAECNGFVDKYADLVIDLLVNDLAPSAVCSALDLCNENKNQLKNSVLECGVCEEAVDIVERLLSNPNVDRKITHIVEKTCYALPAKYLSRCMNMMDIYAESILHLVASLSNSRKVCAKIGLCGPSYHTGVEFLGPADHMDRQKRDQVLGTKKCSWGPSYWCDNEDNANECHALQHCRERVWLGEAPKNKREVLVGAEKCTWGPSYWCVNEDQANECKALKHCQEKVWLAASPHN